MTNMSKVGRNRKGLRWGGPKRETPWKPIQATHVVRYGIVKDKYGREDYKPFIVDKK